MIPILRELSISNFALIEHIHLTFEDGFHVLTGETGAGKSIFVDALLLISGGRSSSEFVRHGAPKAEIEALFEVEVSHPISDKLFDWGVQFFDKTIVIRREITVAGRSSCRINGQIVTLSMLKEIGSLLLDISGQHENQLLLKKEEHLDWLDQFGGVTLLEKRELYQRVYEEILKLQKDLDVLTLDQRETEQRIDLYRYQREEIGLAKLHVGEEEELEAERKRLISMEKLLSHTQKVNQLLHGERGGLDQLRQALFHIGELSRFDESMSQVHENAEHVFFQFEDIVREVNFYSDTLSHDSMRLLEVEDRLACIRQLKRKYGDTINDIIDYKKNITLQLEQLEQRDERENQLTSQLVEKKSILSVYAAELSRLRRDVATQLEKKMHQELSDLNMTSTVFHVSFQGVDFTSTGGEMVEFLISPNRGEPLRPLIKTASGGELSRIMLALKCIFCQQSGFHTLIFDEIDTGVSGRAAQSIAEKMARVAKYHQVLCVTHLPQVACMADVHLFIAKETKEERTLTNIRQLSPSKQLGELARMLSGVEVTQTTYQYAEEMVSLASEVKESL